MPITPFPRRRIRVRSRRLGTGFALVAAPALLTLLGLGPLGSPASDEDADRPEGPPSAATPAGATPAATLAEDASLRPLRAGALGEEAFDSHRAGFEVQVDDRRIVRRVTAVPVLPGATVDVSAHPGGHGTGGTVGAAGYRLRFGAGSAEETAPGRWTWTAPEATGPYALAVERTDGTDAIHLNVLVLVPATEVVDGVLNGYRIGSYVQKPLRGLETYLPPEGFVEVSDADADLLVAPHFTLGQFLCKQPGSPRYVALSLPLLDKLEATLEATNEAGIDAPTFHVMSGFRTPAYNRSIGNETVYSRHLWGDAADIFVDVDGNGDMDDLNGDGRVDLDDARVLYRIVERVEASPDPHDHGILEGGLGLYRRNAVHGPFVHVDARGYAARW